MKTKLPTPQLLPSGQYRCRVMVDGKRLSVVDGDPDLCQAKAVALKNGLLQSAKRPESLTVEEAITRYIDSKDTVLSPATIKGYNKLKRNTMQGIMQTPLSALTQEKIQKEINRMSKTLSPKTIRNAHGLLSAVLSEYHPAMVLRTTLPQKKRYDVAIPTAEDITKIIDTAKGTEAELPILLAVWLGLRASEIRGLTWDCIQGDLLHVKQAIVDGDDGPTLKGTKTYSGNRKLKLPTYIKGLIDSQPQTGAFVVHLSGQAMYKRFSRICKKAGVPHYRFHDLRHANASIMLALGIPDKYAMERMGHATNNMLKTVYQHTMTDKQEEVAESMDAYFTTKLDTILDTNK